jgi:hypothetical protein
MIKKDTCCYMNEKLKILLQAMIIPTICWIVIGYGIYGYYHTSSPAGMADEQTPLGLFVAIFLISYIGGTGMLYWGITNFGFLKKKQNP